MTGGEEAAAMIERCLEELHMGSSFWQTRRGGE